MSGKPTTTPIRVLVKGASTVGWPGTLNTPPGDVTFPRAIENELLRSRPATVYTRSVASQHTKTILRTWESEMVELTPDVIVLVYGHYESMHLFLPRWLERWANNTRGVPRPWRQAFRRRLLSPGWRRLARVQAHVDRRIDPEIRRKRPVNVGKDLTAYITQVRQFGSPLVFVFELLPPGTRARKWLPGMAARIVTMNRHLAETVAAFGSPDVRFFEVGKLAEDYGRDLDEIIPDGFHYSPEFHGVVGRAVAAEISAWAERQPHLTSPRIAESQLG